MAGGARSLWNGTIVFGAVAVPVKLHDPIHYDRSYFLGAGKDGAEAYRLLHDALERSGRAAIGRFTFHNREYLAAIRARGDVLVLHTLRFADELVGADELDVPRAGRKPDKRELKMAAQLVASLHEDFDPSTFRDEYRELVMEAIEAKAKGRELPREEELWSEDGDDLLAALQASVKGS
jgi:DNA end-binding protein Ku